MKSVTHVGAADLLALAGQPPRITLEEAARAAHELYDLEGTLTALEGERDCNFCLRSRDGRQFVLKFIDPQADEVIVAGQSAALTHLAEQAPHLPVPRGIATGAGQMTGLMSTGAGTCRVRLVNYLPGRPFTAAPAHGLMRHAGVVIAELNRALRGFSHPALGQPLAWDIRRAGVLREAVGHVGSKHARDLIDAALAPLAALLPRLRGLRSQAIHGDCHARNLLMNESADQCTGIIDLGDMIHAPLVMEIGVSMAEFIADGMTSPERAEALLKGYISVQPLEFDDIEVLFDLICVRLGALALIPLWRAQNQTPSAGLDAQVDLALAALARIKSWGRAELTAHWHAIAGTGLQHQAGAPSAAVHGIENLLNRRHRALGANAELSYDKPVRALRGDGVWIYTDDGERLLDVYNNVPHVGHAHPVVVEAIAAQARLIASNTRYLDRRIIEYVEMLTATLPAGLDSCLFVNSGSEANDIAWRIARLHTGHEGALVMSHAYHGITDAITALSPAICRTPPPYVEQLAAPLVGAAGAQEELTRAITALRDRGFGVGALMIDSALTSSGIYDPPVEWSTALVTAVRAAGGLIIGDEVQFGLGRSGSHFWGFERRGYQPDIVTLGKPVGNGYPLGVVITRRSLLEAFQKQTGFFSTFGGNPVAAAAGIAVLRVLQEEHLQENARSTGDYFRARLCEVAKAHPTLAAIRGSGLMIGVEVSNPDYPDDTAAAARLTRGLVNGLRRRGVLIGSEGPLANVLKLRPPLPFRPEHADIVIRALAIELAALD